MFTRTNPWTGEEETYAEVTVACQNTGCVNLAITFTVPDAAVMCGACGQWIIPPVEGTP